MWLKFEIKKKLNSIMIKQNRIYKHMAMLL